MTEGEEKMKAKYTVEVEMREGDSPMTERRIETAVWDCAQTPGSIRNVSVRGSNMSDDLSVFATDLFAYGVRSGGKWELQDYFNTYTKAVNAVKRVRVNTLRFFKKDVEIAVFQFNPNTSVWEKC